MSGSGGAGHARRPAARRLATLLLVTVLSGCGSAAHAGSQTRPPVTSGTPATTAAAPTAAAQPTETVTATPEPVAGQCTSDPSQGGEVATVDGITVQVIGAASVTGAGMARMRALIDSLGPAYRQRLAAYVIHFDLAHDTPFPQLPDVQRFAPGASGNEAGLAIRPGQTPPASCTLVMVTWDAYVKRPYAFWDDTIVHEFGHLVGFAGLSDEERSTFLDAYENLPPAPVDTMGPQDGAVSSYAYTSPDELFAEDVAAYLGEPIENADVHKNRAWLQAHEPAMAKLLASVFSNAPATQGAAP